MRIAILLAVLGVAAAMPTNSTLPPITIKIVGGEDTTIHNYPFMANMMSERWANYFQHSCGGSLISRTTVVSAAHCFYGSASIRWRVVLGTSLRSSGGTTHTIARIINHEYYDRPTNKNNDVAIIVLNQPSVFSSNVAPIKLAGPHYDLREGSIVTAIGWGTLQSGGMQPEQLQRVDINVVPQDICEERYRQLKQNPAYEAWPDVTDKMLCAGILDVGGRDACHGDSGGPLIQGDVLVGIVSWGLGCADPFYPGVNARVSALIDWIVQNVAT